MDIQDPDREGGYRAYWKLKLIHPPSLRSPESLQKKDDLLDIVKRL